MTVGENGKRMQFGVAKRCDIATRGFSERHLSKGRNIWTSEMGYGKDKADACPAHAARPALILLPFSQLFNCSCRRLRLSRVPRTPGCKLRVVSGSLALH